MLMNFWNSIMELSCTLSYGNTSRKPQDTPSELRSKRQRVQLWDISLLRQRDWDKNRSERFSKRHHLSLAHLLLLLTLAFHLFSSHMCINRIYEADPPQSHIDKRFRNLHVRDQGKTMPSWGHIVDSIHSDSLFGAHVHRGADYKVMPDWTQFRCCRCV